MRRDCKMEARIGRTRLGKRLLERTSGTTGKAAVSATQSVLSVGRSLVSLIIGIKKEKEFSPAGRMHSELNIRSVLPKQTSFPLYATSVNRRPSSIVFSFSATHYLSDDW